MSDTIEVQGYITFGDFVPIIAEDRRYYKVTLSKSNAGEKFAAKEKILLSKQFQGCATAIVGVGGSRKKLIRFERGKNNMLNVVINADNTKRNELLNKRKEIANATNVIRHDALVIMLVDAVQNSLSSDTVKISLHGDEQIVYDIVQALNSQGFDAFATDINWNKVSVAEPTSPAVPDPERDRKFFVLEPDVNIAFTAAIHSMKFRGYGTVLLTGPSGFGKTTAAQRLAEHLKFDFVKLDCGTLNEANEIASTRGFKDGATVWEETKFIKAFQKGNAVILLDEANRMYPNVANALMPVLDGTGKLTVATEEYNRGNNVIFIATMNRGAQYVGTFESDAAFLNRFAISARVGELTGEEEAMVVYHHTQLALADAKSIVKILRELRKTIPNSPLDFSPRMAENIALAYGSGLDMFLSFRAALQAIAEPTDWKAIIDTLQINGFKSGKSPKKLF